MASSPSSISSVRPSQKLQLQPAAAVSLLNDSNDGSKAEKAADESTIESFLRLSWYCARVLLLAEFALLGSAGNMVFMVYAGAAPKAVPCVGDGFTLPDLCKIPVDERSNYTCTPNPDYEFCSLNVEFNYLCEETSTVKSSISSQMVGILFGALAWGHFADARGRKMTLMITFSALVVTSLLNAFATSLFVFNVIRTVNAFFNGGSLIVLGVYQMEHVPRKHRFLISTLIAWAPNYIIISILAWWSADWRTFQLALVVISLPALPLLFFVFESPRWLIQRGRIAEARECLQRIQEIDGMSNTNEAELQKMIGEEHEKVAERNSKAKNYNFTHLFRYKEMALTTTVLSLGVMTTSIISFGLMFNMEILAGSLFLNSIFLGAMKWTLNLGYGVLDYHCSWMGRKFLHTMAQTIVIIGLFVLFVVKITGNEDIGGLIRSCTILSAGFVSQVFLSKGMLAMEYFPTVIRNSAISFKTTFSRLGAVLAPQLFLLPYDWLPYLILTILALADTVALLLVVPETKGKPLPETMPERKKKKKDEHMNEEGAPLEDIEKA